MEDVTESLKKHIIEVLNLPDVKPEDIDENSPLVGGDLGIDSIDILELVVMIEKEYGVEIKGEEIGQKVFTSLATLAEYINSKKV